MAQTSYSVNPEVGYRGLLADPNRDAFIIPMANGAAAAQGFGIMVKRDATNPEEQFDIFSAAGQKPLGITVHTHAQEDPSLTDPAGIALLESASILRRGRIWVRVEEAITVGDPVYFRHTSGTGTEIGAFRNDADGTGEVITCTPTVVEDVIYGLDITVDGDDYHFEAVADGSAGDPQITTCTPTIVENDIYGLDIVYGTSHYHFEAKADGSAGNAAIWTLTPTATNTTLYRLQCHIPAAPGATKDFYFEYTSDASATAAEIVAGFQAVMAADSDFTALFVASGTDTLILTGQTGGMEIVIMPGGAGTWASITETQAAGTATATTLLNKFRTLMAANAAFTAQIVASGTTTLILTGQDNGQDFTVNDAGHGTWASITETQAAGTSTATTLCNKFRTLMAADTAFTALVVASGTDTLILTGQVAGASMRVISAGHGSWASITQTTAPGPKCDLVENAEWLRGSAAAGVALLEINLP
jgi:hypothetical protein